VGRSGRDDHVAGCFELVVFDHCIAEEDEAEAPFAPPFVEIDELFGGDAAFFEVIGVPGGQALGHGCFHAVVELACEIWGVQ